MPLDHDLSAQFLARPAREQLLELARAAEERDWDFDAYGAGRSLQAFEARVAALLRKPAAAFFVTGTAAQQAALLALAAGTAPLAARRERPTVLVHPTSHLVFLDCLHDADDQAALFAEAALETLPEFEVRAAGEFGRVLSCADVEQALAAAPADVLVVELPQRMNGGATIALEELSAVSRLCRERGVALHCDGARLWEVEPHYGVPLAEVAALFDSVYVSFYKGVGALACAMLIGSEELVRDARVWQKRRGGDLFTRGPLALSCDVALGDAAEGGAVAPGSLAFAQRRLRMQELVQLVGAEVAAAGRGARVRFDPAVPQTAMVHCYLRGERVLLEACHERAQERSGVRLWNRFRGRGHSVAPAPGEGSEGEWSYFEWTVGLGNAGVPDSAVSAGWRAFLEEWAAAAASAQV